MMKNTIYPMYYSIQSNTNNTQCQSNIETINFETYNTNNLQNQNVTFTFIVTNPLVDNDRSNIAITGESFNASNNNLIVTDNNYPPTLNMVFSDALVITDPCKIEKIFLYSLSSVIRTTILYPDVIDPVYVKLYLDLIFYKQVGSQNIPFAIHTLYNDDHGVDFDLNLTAQYYHTYYNVDISDDITYLEEPVFLPGDKIVIGTTYHVLDSNGDPYTSYIKSSHDANGMCVCMVVKPQ